MALTFTELGNASVAKQLLNLSFKTYTSKFCSDKATQTATKYGNRATMKTWHLQKQVFRFRGVAISQFCNILCKTKQNC